MCSGSFEKRSKSYFQKRPKIGFFHTVNIRYYISKTTSTRPKFLSKTTSTRPKFPLLYLKFIKLSIRPM